MQSHMGIKMKHYFDFYLLKVLGPIRNYCKNTLVLQDEQEIIFISKMFLFIFIVSTIFSDKIPIVWVETDFFF